MSASEKLRALDVNKWPWWQITEVVEAAEATEEHPNLTGGANRICKICGYDLNFAGHGPYCALAALEEVLS